MLYFFVPTEIIKIMLIISIETASVGVEYKERNEKSAPEEKVGSEKPKMCRKIFVNRTLKSPCSRRKIMNKG